MINDALHRLNSVLFGPQEYAIVATYGKDTATMTAESVRRSADHVAREGRASGGGWYA